MSQHSSFSSFSLEYKASIDKLKFQSYTERLAEHFQTPLNQVNNRNVNYLKIPENHRGPRI